MELFLDTETSDLYNFKKPHDDISQPWIVQLGFILSERDAIYQEGNLIVKAHGRRIAPNAEAIHCISSNETDMAGIPENVVLEVAYYLIKNTDLIVCHNINFDIKVLFSLMSRDYPKNLLKKLLNSDYHYCTMLKGTPICKLPGRYGNYKWPKLEELYTHLFGEKFPDAHDALADVRATRRCYYKMTE